MIDRGRLQRAIWLDYQRISLDQFLVIGGVDDHVVVVDGGYVRCGCVDAILHGDNCKHSLLTRLICGDPAVVAALRQLVPRPSRVVRAA